MAPEGRPFQMPLQALWCIAPHMHPSSALMANMVSLSLGADALHASKLHLKVSRSCSLHLLASSYRPTHTLVPLSLRTSTVCLSFGTLFISDAADNYRERAKRRNPPASYTSGSGGTGPGGPGGGGPRARIFGVTDLKTTSGQ